MTLSSMPIMRRKMKFTSELNSADPTLLQRGFHAATAAISTLSTGSWITNQAMGASQNSSVLPRASVTENPAQEHRWAQSILWQSTGLASQGTSLWFHDQREVKLICICTTCYVSQELAWFSDSWIFLYCYCLTDTFILIHNLRNA